MQALRDKDIRATWVRVDTREAFVEALSCEPFDFIFSGDSMPSFDGLTAPEQPRWAHRRMEIFDYTVLLQNC